MATSLSMAGTKRSMNSTTVTWLPRALPHAAELQPDIPAADHHQVAGHLVQLQRAGAGNDALFVHRDTRQVDAGAAGGDHDVLGVINLAIDIHLAGGGDAGAALQPGNLVLLEQELHALHVGADHLALAGLHARQVQLHAVKHHPVIGEMVAGFLEVLAALQQGLAGDAADVQAGAAQGGALLHAGGLQAQLRGADGAHVAPRAAADDDDVVGFGHGFLAPSPRFRERAGVRVVGRL